MKGRDRVPRAPCVSSLIDDNHKWSLEPLSSILSTFRGSETAWARLYQDAVKVQAMVCPNPCSGVAALFYARSNLQEANLKMPVSHSKQSIYSLCGSIQQVRSTFDVGASDNA